jgi:hypothetical protein
MIKKQSFKKIVFPSQMFYGAFRIAGMLQLCTLTLNHSSTRKKELPLKTDSHKRMPSCLSSRKYKNRYFKEERRGCLYVAMNFICIASA